MPGRWPRLHHAVSLRGAVPSALLYLAFGVCRLDLNWEPSIWFSAHMCGLRLLLRYEKSGMSGLQQQKSEDGRRFLG